MIYVIAKINEKQYKVVEGQELEVDRLQAKAGQRIDIKDVLLVSQDETMLIGEDAKKAVVKAKVVEDSLAPKILVFKYKKRSRYRRLKGHRQPFTKLIIETIEFPGKKAEKKQASKPKRQASGKEKTEQEAQKTDKEKSQVKKKQTQEKKTVPKKAKYSAKSKKSTESKEK